MKRVIILALVAFFAGCTPELREPIGGAVEHDLVHQGSRELP